MNVGCLVLEYINYVIHYSYINYILPLTWLRIYDITMYIRPFVMKFLTAIFTLLSTSLLNMLWSTCFVFLTHY